MFATLEVKTAEVTLIQWEGESCLAAQTWILADFPEIFTDQTQLTKLAKDVGGWLNKPIEALVWQEKFEENTSADRLAEELAIALTKKWGGEIVTVPALWEETLPEVAQISGLPEIVRLGVYDRVAHEAALYQVGKLAPLDGRFIVACLGQTVSIAAYAEGRLLDVNNSWDGDGPMGLMTAGTLPSSDLVKWAFTSGQTHAEAEKKLVNESGWAAYQKTMTEEQWHEILAYQVVKEIGSMQAVLRGRVDGVILTGELTKRPELVRLVTGRLPDTVEVYVLPGSDVARGLAVLWQEEKRAEAILLRELS